jgi:4-hydroxy-tetrahydrodipicolinate synthase
MPVFTTPSAAQASPALSGLWVPLVTPFAPDGDVDHAALSALTGRLRAQGVSGVVACGSTGEAAALDKAEQLAVLETVLHAAQGLPVVMGVSGHHLGQMLAWLGELSRYPLAGLLVPAPHYIRPAQPGLLQWFRAIADEASAPIVLYDIPYRTGATLTTETLMALAEHPRIVAIKDCGGEPAKTQALIADGRLAVLGGEDAQMFATLALGGAGAIAASAHWQTARFVELITLLRQGDLPGARSAWMALQPWIAACFAEPNPAPLKALLAQAGWMHNVLRAPMTAASPALQAQLGRFSRP